MKRNLISAIISIALCFFVIVPLISPSIQAYAEDQRISPPEKELLPLTEPVTEEAEPTKNTDTSTDTPPDAGKEAIPGTKSSVDGSTSASAETPAEENTAKETPQEGVPLPGGSAHQPPDPAEKPTPELNETPVTEEISLKEPEIADIEEAHTGELLSIEDEHTLTYEEERGSFSTEFYAERVAYEDGQGGLSLIDNTLEQVDPLLAPAYYENAAADYEVTLPKVMNELNGVSFSKDGYSVELIPIGGDFSRSLSKENAVMYTEVYPYVDYQYTLVNDTIKEDIIVNQYIESPSFSFELKTGDLLAKQEGNDVIVYRDGEEEPYWERVKIFDSLLR